MKVIYMIVDNRFVGYSPSSHLGTNIVAKTAGNLRHIDNCSRDVELSWNNKKQTHVSQGEEHDLFISKFGTILRRGIGGLIEIECYPTPGKSGTFF